MSLIQLIKPRSFNYYLIKFQEFLFNKGTVIIKEKEGF